ncbi:hypothetical protein [Actinokineospora globicatena]|uniref:hypothetical protein n=1 Tax=Actinokineospora globicatena TaxID=103729 RepID=UPI0020A5E276|nr:hypothetical protein [Actinokineospora globicatena]MCP2306137.1 hypothetical protein [Actinokineospora globicatena]GLW79988.1 hypothetical protein Aglo01_44690 [Actinokineospora globicatena]GLW86817.1 hypothetical protein Aglo02_44560 [Actinokineospora globicatena]
MESDVPDPVPVVDLIARPGRPSRARESHLLRAEVAEAWPVVWNHEAVAWANGVRSGEQPSYGTWGAPPGPTEYEAEDVQRVADAIAGGTAVLEPRWRRDTEEGREAQRRHHEHWRRKAVRARWMVGAFVLLMLGGIGVLWYVSARS